MIRHDPDYAVLLDRDDLLVQKRQLRQPDRIVDENFGGALRLTGYSLVPQGDKILIALDWLTAGPQQVDYHYFVHILDDQNKIFSQQDGELIQGLLPASKWRAGHSLREEISLPTPSASQWSHYSVEIGWYDLATNQRLTLRDGRDHLLLPLSATQ